jgi:hypothetical protein
MTRHHGRSGGGGVGAGGRNIAVIVFKVGARGHRRKRNRAAGHDG